MLPSKLKYQHELLNPNSFFFSKNTMKFFGDTMKNYGVRSIGDYYELYTMFLVNNIPLKVVIIRDSYYCDDGDYSVRGVLSAGSRIYHSYYIKNCVVDNHRVYYIYNTQKDCDGYTYIKTIENEYMTLRYYRNLTTYGISVEKNDLGLKIRDLLYISGFID